AGPVRCSRPAKGVPRTPTAPPCPVWPARRRSLLWPTPTDSGTLETPRTAAPAGLAAVVGRAGASAHHRLRTVAAAGSTRAPSDRHELARPRPPRPGYPPLVGRPRPRPAGRRERDGRVAGER